MSSILVIPKLCIIDIMHIMIMIPVWYTFRILSASWCNPISFTAIATSLQVSFSQLCTCGTSWVSSPAPPPIASILWKGNQNTCPETPHRCLSLDQILSTWESHENEAGSTSYQDRCLWHHLLIINAWRFSITPHVQLITSVDVIIVSRLKSYFELTLRVYPIIQCQRWNWVHNCNFFNGLSILK